MASTALNTADRFRIGRVFHDSFAVIGRNLVLCVGLGVGLYALPRFVLWLWYVKSGGTRPPFGTFIAQHLLLAVLGVLFYLCFTAILQASVMRVAIQDLRGQRPSFSDSFGLALIMLFPVIGTSVLLMLGVLIGLVLLIVPGVLLMLRWAVAVPVLIQEKRGILDSMARSRDLTNGSRWPLFGLWLILIVAGALAGQVIIRIAIPLNVTFGLLADSILTASVTVVSAVAGAVSYVELRRIKEGAGVEELAEIFS